MRVLLFVLGVLALVSGGLKFRERVMHKIGTSRFAIVEVGLGVLACAIAMLVSEGIVLQSIVAGVTFVAIFAGAYHQSKLTAAFRHRRELSESHRLKQFVDAESPPTPEPSPEAEDHGA